MWNEDRPIDSPDQDRFGYANIAHHFVEMMRSRSSKENLIVGIEGDWGQGKSSLLNLIRSRIKQITEQDILVINFEPWLYSGHQDLVLRFFDEFIQALGKQTHSKVARIAEALEGIKNCLTPMRLIPGVKDAYDLLDEASSQAKAIKQSAETAAKDLRLQRELARTALLQTDQKLFVFIDDIDRLGRDEILEVFRAIKAIADFPNVVYILAYDVVRVAEALENYGGKGYLEKIVQVPFSLPPLHGEELELISRAMVFELFQGSGPFSARAEKLLRLLSILICRDVSNLRGLKRTVNLLRSRLYLRPPELDPSGFAVVQTLLHLFPEQAQVFRQIIDQIIDRRQNRLAYLISSLPSPDKLLAELVKSYPPAHQDLVGSLFDTLYVPTEASQECLSIILPNDPLYFSSFFTTRLPPALHSPMTQVEFWSRCSLGVDECVRVLGELILASPVALVYFVERAIERRFSSLEKQAQLNFFYAILQTCDIYHRALDSASNPLNHRSGVRVFMEAAQLLLPVALAELQPKDIGPLLSECPSFCLLHWLAGRATEMEQEYPEIAVQLRTLSEAIPKAIGRALKANRVSLSTPVLGGVLFFCRSKTKGSQVRLWLARRIKAPNEFAEILGSFTADSTSLTGENRGTRRRVAQFWLLSQLSEVAPEKLISRARKALRSRSDSEWGDTAYWLRRLSEWDGVRDGIMEG